MILAKIVQSNPHRHRFETTIDWFENIKQAYWYIEYYGWVEVLEDTQSTHLVGSD